MGILYFKIFWSLLTFHSGYLPAFLTDIYYLASSGLYGSISIPTDLAHNRWVLFPHCAENKFWFPLFNMSSFLYQNKTENHRKIAVNNRKPCEGGWSDMVCTLEELFVSCKVKTSTFIENGHRIVLSRELLWNLSDVQQECNIWALNPCYPFT